MPEHGRNHNPRKAPPLSAPLRTLLRQHGQAAGEEDERHERTLVMLWNGPWPVGSGVTGKSVGEQATCESGAVGDDEEPHRHFSGTANAGAVIISVALVRDHLP